MWKCTDQSGAARATNPRRDRKPRRVPRAELIQAAGAAALHGMTPEEFVRALSMQRKLQKLVTK